MSTKDTRTPSTTDKGKTGSGYRTVTFRDGKGIERDARVIGPGTGSGVKLEVQGGTGPAGTTGSRVVDNVALGTAKNQTGVYFNSKYNA